MWRCGGGCAGVGFSPLRWSVAKLASPRFGDRDGEAAVANWGEEERRVAAALNQGYPLGGGFGGLAGCGIYYEYVRSHAVGNELSCCCKDARKRAASKKE